MKITLKSFGFIDFEIVSDLLLLLLWQGGMRAIISIGVIHAFILVSFIVSIASLGINHIGFDEIWDRAVDSGRIHSPE